MSVVMFFMPTGQQSSGVARAFKETREAVPMTLVFAGAAPWQAIHDGPSSKASGILQNAHLGYQAQVDTAKFRVVLW